MMKNEKSIELTEKFNRYYPGGHTNYRIPLQVTQNRVFIQRAEGSHLWDVDGNEYIDYMGAMGPGILGHRHPEYIQALKEFMDDRSLAIGSGILFSEDDIKVAEKIIDHVPCAEKVKFCITGTEAVQMAIRLARAYTNRPYFIRFGGHYHGWLDNVLGGVINPNPTGKPFAIDDPSLDPFTDFCYTGGKSRGAVEESFLLPWNDIEALEQTLKKFGDEIAIIHFEPLVCNHFNLMPRPGFLDQVRELCTQYGIVMSFDEVITGFRLGLGGAQDYFGIIPDIATLGKALGGGLPFSAVVGKADIMNLLEKGKVLGPGTFNGYPFGMRAVLATLEILERNDGEAYIRMDDIQSRLMDGLKEISKRHAIPLYLQGAPGVFFTMFGFETESPVYTDEDLKNIDFNLYLQFWDGMQQEGIITLAGGRWYLSIVHSDEDVDMTLEAADHVIGKL